MFTLLVQTIHLFALLSWAHLPRTNHTQRDMASSHNYSWLIAFKRYVLLSCIDFACELLFEIAAASESLQQCALVLYTMLNLITCNVSYLMCGPHKKWCHFWPCKAFRLDIAGLKHTQVCNMNILYKISLTYLTLCVFILKKILVCRC